MALLHRRHFLQSTVGAAAAGTLLTRVARADVNSEIRVAVIGVRSRGKSHLDGLSDHVVAICDCDRQILGERGEEYSKKFGRKLEQFVDYRELLDRKDIDAVTIATPNHTHALIGIAAAQAGKDVYVEKPISHNVWEGRQLAEAARTYDRMIQCGTQSRSNPSLHDAVAYVQSGKLGAIQYAIGTCYKPRPSIGKLDSPLEIPAHVDYDLWCGPADKVDLYRPQLHYDWHWDFNTGSGDMGNQGIHQMDIARWFLGEEHLSPRVASFGGRLGYDDAGNTPNTQVVLHDYAKAPLVFETRGLPSSKAAQSNWGKSMDRFRGSGIGVIIQCEEGHLLVPSYREAIAYDNDGNQVKHWKGGGDHYHYSNFIDAVRSRKREDLNAEVEKGHISSALCHTGNISHRLGEQRTAKQLMEMVSANALLADSVERMLEHLRANEVDVDRPVVTAGAWLEMDPEAEQFTNNGAANQLLRREGRAPFVVPEVS